MEDTRGYYYLKTDKMPETRFEGLLGERLAYLHPLAIISEIILPAIDQIIEDFEDALSLFDQRYDKEQIRHHMNLIKFWKGIKKQIEQATGGL